MKQATRFIGSADGVSERMGGFMAHLRDNGIAVGIDEFRHSIRALESVNALSSRDVRLACKAVCARKFDSFSQFDEVFDAYWLNGGHENCRYASKPIYPAHRPGSHSARPWTNQKQAGHPGNLMKPMMGMVMMSHHIEVKAS